MHCFPLLYQTDLSFPVLHSKFHLSPLFFSFQICQLFTSLIWNKKRHSQSRAFFLFLIHVQDISEIHFCISYIPHEVVQSVKGSIPENGNPIRIFRQLLDFVAVVDEIVNGHILHHVFECLQSWCKILSCNILRKNHIWKFAFIQLFGAGFCSVRCEFFHQIFDQFFRLFFWHILYVIKLMSCQIVQFLF